LEGSFPLKGLINHPLGITPGSPTKELRNPLEEGREKERNWKNKDSPKKGLGMGS